MNESLYRHAERRALSAPPLRMGVRARRAGVRAKALPLQFPAIQPALLPAQEKVPHVLYALYHAPGNQVGSLEEQIVFLSRGFAKQNSKFIPLFLTDKPQASLRYFTEQGVHAECMPFAGFRLKTFLALSRQIKEHKIDVLHWNFTPPLKNPYAWALRLRFPRLKHWFTDHSSRPDANPSKAPAGWRRLIKALLLKNYDTVLGVSQFVKEDLERQAVWPKPVAIPHFVNTDRFRPDLNAGAELRREHNSAEKFILLTVAQLIPEKGIHLGIKALQSLPEHVELWLVGGGPEDMSLRLLAVESGVGDRVKFFGKRSDVHRFMQAADLFVCPSLWAEAAGLVLLEAQSCGLPVVASRIGGIPEQMLDGRTGLLFSHGNLDELVLHLQRLEKGPAARKKFSIQAREWALSRFSPGVRIPAMLDLYRKGR